MFIQLADYITAYVLPAGRAVFAGRKVLIRAQETNVQDIYERASAFVDAANTNHGLELRYRATRKSPLYGAEAARLDARVDRRLGALDRTVANYVDLSSDPDVDPAMKEAAGLLSSEMFPRGLTFVTLMSYPEEFESVSKLLVRLQGTGDLAGAVATLSLQPFVSTLAKANAEFGVELDKAPKVAGPRWDEIRVARAATHERQLEYIAKVLGTFFGADDATATNRTTLLDPLMVQQRALVALYKGRRGGQDVDPDTGEVDPNAPEEPVLPPEV